MADQTLLPEKPFQYLVHLFDTSTTYDVHEFLTHSKIYTSRDYGSSFSDAYAFRIVVDPEIFKKYQGLLKQFKGSISSKFYQFTQVSITKVEVFPDLNRFMILENRIVPINTPWEQINKSQSHLLELLRTAKETIDFQNIGNASRTLLQNLSTIIFKPEKHKPENPDIDVSEAKFKNRLHTYIRCELGGSENKELRDYALSVVTTAEKSIDLSNKLTHDLNANSLMAEFCVISTITVISILKLIDK